MVRRGLQGRLRFMQFRILNAINGVANQLTAGQMHLSNPFQTEELGGLFKRLYEPLLRPALEASGLSAHFSPHSLVALLQPRFRERYLSEKFQLLNLVNLRLPATAPIREAGRS
jgi:hypothetical protein